MELKFVQQSRCQVLLTDLSISHDIPVPAAKQDSAARRGLVLKFAKPTASAYEPIAGQPRPRREHRLVLGSRSTSRRARTDLRPRGEAAAGRDHRRAPARRAAGDGARPGRGGVLDALRRNDPDLRAFERPAGSAAEGASGLTLRAMSNPALSRKPPYMPRQASPGRRPGSRLRSRRQTMPLPGSRRQAACANSPVGAPCAQRRGVRLMR